MAYTVRSSEKLRKAGADTETKALLYLMNFHQGHDDIYYFVVDFFNDLTGMDNMAGRLWDVQSKGAHNVSPKEIGKELVTLFKNYISDLTFEAYILFVGSVTCTLRKYSSLKIFNIKNIKENALPLIKAGLVQEGQKKEYIDNTTLFDENINAFLNKVLFVIDENQKPSDYVKAIISQHPNIIHEENVLTAIFNEIRDKQSSKKNVSSVEGITIEATDEVINYCRHLTANEIRLLTLHRIINRNPLEKGVPASFLSIYQKLPPEQQKDTLEACQRSLCLALFNKNASGDFWLLFEKTYQSIINNPDGTVQQLFQHIKSYNTSSLGFDVLSLKYFIALIKEGIRP